MAKLTAVYGPMFAGKTTWILDTIAKQEQLGEKLLVIKPRLDDRYGKEAMLHSHNGKSGIAVLVDESKPQEILGIWTELGEQHATIVIDEVMFFDPVIIEVIKELLARELGVIVAGLDTNYKKEPFGIMSRLIKLADTPIQLRSRCYRCGEAADFTQRLSGGSADIEVGASDRYQPACVDCHTIFQEKKVLVPDLRIAKKSQMIRIEVAADSMRVGKTTAVKVIAEGLRKQGIEVSESYEDWQNNPHLKKSYSDPAKSFLDSQKWFIKRKWEQIKDGGEGKVFIQDVAPETDYCYAATNVAIGRMSRKHFSNYDKYYRSLNWQQAPLPDLLVYLKVSDKELIKRAEESKREFETVDSKYFLEMKKINRAWLESVRGKREVLEVDTDKLNFAHEETAKKELAERVIEKFELV